MMGEYSHVCTRPSGCYSRGPFLKLWERIRYFIPGCFESHENVFAWAHTRITFDRSQHHLRDFPGMGSHKRGPALLAKAPLSCKGGLVGLDKFDA